MLGLILAVGVSMVTVGDFIKQIEATGHERVLAVGLDRSLPLTEGDVVEIGHELGIQLTTEFRRRAVDRGKVQYLVWVLTPEEQGKKKHDDGDHPGHGKGKHKGHTKSNCDPGGE